MGIMQKASDYAALVHAAALLDEVSSAVKHCTADLFREENGDLPEIKGRRVGDYHINSRRAKRTYPDTNGIKEFLSRISAETGRPIDELMDKVMPKGEEPVTVLWLSKELSNDRMVELKKRFIDDPMYTDIPALIEAVVSFGTDRNWPRPTMGFLVDSFDLARNIRWEVRDIVDPEALCVLHDRLRSAFSAITEESKSIRQELYAAKDSPEGYKINQREPRRYFDAEAWKEVTGQDEFPSKTSSFQIFEILNPQDYQRRLQFSNRSVESPDEGPVQSSAEADRLFGPSL